MPRKEPVQLRSKQQRDKFNDPTGPEPEWREIPGGAVVVPRNSQDYEQRGPIVVSGFMVVVSTRQVAIDDTDEVRIRGRIYQIEGEIADYGAGKPRLFYTMRAN